MSACELPTRQESPREARVEMTHKACGGKADLTILMGLSNVIYVVQCYDCGYVEAWSLDQAVAAKQKFLI